MTDLFDPEWTDRNEKKYPESAGHQGGDTDRESAEKIEGSGRADLLRGRVLEVMKCDKDGLTADECAFILEEDILSIRPRFTELKQRKVLFDTGTRRPSQNGRSQRVLIHRDFIKNQP